MTGLVDVHAHFVPDWYVDLARAAGIEQPDGMPSWPAWDAAEHLAFLDRHGIDRALLSLSSPGVVLGPAVDPVDLARRVNDDGARHVREHPRGFGLLATLPLPDAGAALAELDRALDVLGADGVALLTNAGGVTVADPELEPVWRALGERGCAVLLHPTTAIGAPPSQVPAPMAEFLFETSRTVLALALGGTLARNPGVRLVVPHSGSVLPLLVDRAAMFQLGAKLQGSAPDGLEIDEGIDEVLQQVWWDLAGTPTALHVRGLTERYGSDRIVYGSDFCFTPGIGVTLQQELLDREAEGAGLPDWRARTTANAERLASRP